MPSGLEIALTWDFVARFMSIMLIDLALSGDNAIVIGMAAAALPRNQRKLAIVAGAGLAIVLRVVLTTVATLLLMVPLLSAVGGVALFWVAWRLLRMDTGKQSADGTRPGRAHDRLRDAVVVIVTADVSMSMDNVIAVAGTAHGSVFLIVAGLLLSMPLLMTTGGAVSLLIDRFTGLVYIGAGVICLTGTRMIFEDAVVVPWIPLQPGAVFAIAAIVGLAFPAAFVAGDRRRAARAALEVEISRPEGM